MGSDTTAVNKTLFNHFIPLRDLDHHHQEQLAKKSLIVDVDKLKTIVKHPQKASLHHYLISGDIEIRYSFDDRKPVPQSDPLCCRALEHEIQNGGMIRALTPCRVLIVNPDLVNEWLSVAQSYDYKLVPLQEQAEQTLNSAIIDDDYEDDWTESFFQSPLASHLSPSALHQLMSQLEEVHLRRGDCVIEPQTPGDYFYIIKSGQVRVAMPGRHNKAPEQYVELSSGEYFGDEALVANTVRNAAVTMKSDGVLGRLARADFDELVKKSLVLTTAAMELTIERECCYLDVRTPIEFKRMGCSLPNCVNLPVHQIRSKINTLDASKVYIISGESGQRGELATYLLRQAGIDAYFADQPLVISAGLG